MKKLLIAGLLCTSFNTFAFGDKARVENVNVKYLGKSFVEHIYESNKYIITVIDPCSVFNASKTVKARLTFGAFGNTKHLLINNMVCLVSNFIKK